MARLRIGSLALISVFLASCDGGGGESGEGGPGEGPGVAGGPAWADEWTLGFVGEGERPAAREAYFVRLVGATIGGNFDELGDEEVCFSIASRGKRILLRRRSLSLARGSVTEYSLPGTPMVELYPEEPIAFVVYVDDVDVTEYERITSAECRLTATEFPDRESERTFPAQAIKGSGRTLEGASVTLSLVRAPRSDEPDPDTLGTARRLFAGFRAEKEPRTTGEVRELAGSLEAAAREAVVDAGSSLHTYRRNLLAGLARAAGSLAARARELGTAGGDDLRNEQAELAEALARIRSEGKAGAHEEEFRAAMAIADRPIPEELDAPALDEFLAEVGRVRGSYEIAEKRDGEFRRAFFGAIVALKDLAEAAVRARKGLGSRAGFEDSWRRFQDELRASLPE
ncbi:MAG: hypothetical protein HY720_29775 [Planctomycetes bacterium]|nr:hypothetical protein [Planctomycetota bacterium]